MKHHSSGGNTLRIATMSKNHGSQGAQSSMEPTAMELQQELKNFEDFSKANYPLVKYDDTHASSLADAAG